MPMSERAKIFVPFNPLKGFSEALRAKEREVEAAALDDRGGSDLEAPDSETKTPGEKALHDSVESFFQVP